MEVLTIVIAGVIGLAIGLAASKLLFKSSGISQSQYDRLVKDHASAQAKLDAIQQQLDTARDECQVLRRESVEAQKQKTALETEKKHLSERVAQHKIDLEAMQKQLATQFENLANKIFTDKSAHFKQQSGEHLQGLLNPFKEQLGEFKKQVEQQGKEQYSLKSEIQRIVLTSESLTKALKGDVKAQGSWGEVMLERILEESGLRKGIDYVAQGTGMGLKHPETGRDSKPDYIIRLPENKHVILDSKVSLTHYERYIAAQQEDERNVALRQFLQSLHEHVKNLESKRYQDTDGLGTPDFVLLFVPIEGAYSLAVQQDDALHSFAWAKKIVLVCPSTLFATLRTVASLWRLELQNRNAQEIAKRGGLLYDKMVLFTNDLQAVGQHLQKASNVYEKTFERFSQGPGNLLRQAEQLKQLGAKASKTMKQELLEAEHDLEVALLEEQES